MSWIVFNIVLIRIIFFVSVKNRIKLDNIYAVPLFPHKLASEINPGPIF